jgi:hypothetical protein
MKRLRVCMDKRRQSRDIKVGVWIRGDREEMKRLRVQWAPKV